MRFRITRTSGGYACADSPPCEGAIWDPLADDGEWKIDIDTLDDLMDLCEREGDLVLNHYNAIEIYDNYRE